MIDEKEFRNFGFDLKKAEEFTGGGEELEIALKTFAKCYEKNRLDITANFEMGMYIHYVTNVHSLKSNLRTIGLEKLSKTAEKCEALAKKYSEETPNAREEAEFEKINQILLQEYKEVVDFINEQLADEDDNSSEDKEINNSRVVSLLDDFISRCEDFDDDRARADLKEIYKYRIELIAKNHIDLAKRYIEEFEYDEAVSEAREAKKNIDV